MPNKDGTGPEGKGSKTGRGMGRCGGRNSADTNQSAGQPGAGRGMGMGMGQGRGRRTQANNE